MIEIASTSWISISTLDDLHFNVRVSTSARALLFSPFLFSSFPFSFLFLLFLSFLFHSFSLSCLFLSCLSLLIPAITSTSGPKSRRLPPLFPPRSRRCTAVSSVRHPPASSTALAAGKSSWSKAAAREKFWIVFRLVVWAEASWPPRHWWGSWGTSCRRAWDRIWGIGRRNRP